MFGIYFYSNNKSKNNIIQRNLCDYIPQFSTRHIKQNRSGRESLVTLYSLYLSLLLNILWFGVGWRCTVMTEGMQEDDPNLLGGKVTFPSLTVLLR